MKRFVTFSLSLILLLSVLSPIGIAHASALTPRYTYTDVIKSELEINQITGIAQCYGFCQTNDPSYYVRVEVRLEQYFEDEDRWETVKVWRDFGDGLAGNGGYWAVERGFEFRVRTVGHILDANNVELETATAILTKHLN